MTLSAELGSGQPTGAEGEGRRPTDSAYPDVLPFTTIHVLLLGVFWVDVGWSEVLLCGFLYVVRMFAVTAGYHRYFSHRSFKISRPAQLLLALLSQSSGQRGVLWWAAHHRAHHCHSDSTHDPHSPIRDGFWHAHVGWIFADKMQSPNYSLVRDLARFPELVWLNNRPYISLIALGLGTLLFFGASGFFFGFLVSTVLLYHATFAINSLAHGPSLQKYDTGDHSRNGWVLGIVTMGEGWHNNHHRFPAYARQGLLWWEIDLTYYALLALASIGLVRDLKGPAKGRS